MKILLKSPKVHFPGSKINGKRRNILIENGTITKISDKDHRADQVVDCSGLEVSVGWFDMWTLFGDPGLEQKEDIRTGLSAAAEGGFTGVSLLPNTVPPIDTKNDVTYLISRSEGTPVDVHPIAAVTKGTEGEDLTEMIDMYHAGAVAFSDGIRPIVSTDIVLKALQYLKKYNCLLINRAEDKDLTMFATMHEGRVSTELGMRGMPRLAEEIAIERDIKLLDYAGGKLHFANISAFGSVDIIKKARAKYQVSCDVAAHNLVFTDQSAEGFDANFKVDPPFRTEKDIKALIRGLNNDSIDVIVSAHNPQDSESKNLEFDLAEFGVTGLQTLFPILVSIADQVPLEKLIEKITVNPRRLLGLEQPVIEEGADANLTLFSTKHSWILDETTNRSRSVNSPFWGQTLKGKAMGVFNRGTYWLDPTLSQG